MSTHSLPIRVYYEDTDAGGIVYHASYLRFAERGRTEMLRDNGFVHTELLRDKKIAFAIRHMEIDYAKPAFLDDALVLQSRITRVGGASFDMEQIIRRGEEILVQMRVVLVCMSVESLSATRVPDDIRTIFESESEGETINV